MKILGLTGSIGMGKSTVSKFFKEARIAVFDSDQSVHGLMNKGGEAVGEVAKAFPESYVEEAIDRQILGANIFKNPEALKKLENILHPLVSKARKKFLEEMKEQDKELVLLDVPLLFETGIDSLCDYILVVTAPAEVQKERVLARKNMSEEKFNSILANQMRDEIKRQKADFLIFTDKGFENAKAETSKIIAKLTRETKPETAS